jgi:Type II restriction endonuclease, TdeIII
MNEQTVASVKSVLLASLRRTLQRRQVEEPYNPEEFRLTSPFYARLVPGEIWRAAKFERSFVTSIGQGVFEQVAVNVARDAGSEAEQGYRETSEVWTGQLTEIQNILTNLRAGTTRPNWLLELSTVNNAVEIGKKVTRTVISDLYVKKQDGTRNFYSLKTVKPNLDQTEKAKSDLLTLRALNINNVTFFALPYNPYITRQSYNWQQPFKIFDMRQDPCVLIGDEFWDDIGGVGTYKQLLEVFEETGEEFAPEIQAYLDGLI